MRQTLSFLHICSDFRSSRSGAVALTFGVAVLLLLVLGGAAVDYGHTVSERTKTQAAADMAALAAARAAADELSRLGSTDASKKNARAAADAAAKALLFANLSPGVAKSDPTVTVTTTMEGDAVTALVSVDGAVPTTILPILGVETFPLDVVAESTLGSSTTVHEQTLFLIDVSNSMTVGGMPSDIDLLERTAGINCAFACHDPAGHSVGFESCTGTDCDKRALAAKAGIKLKIDYAKDAVRAFVGDVKSSTKDGGASGRRTIGLYSFGTAYRVVLDVTASLPEVEAAVDALDVETAIAYDDDLGFTRISEALQTLAGRLSKVGDGSSESRRKTSVVLVTDGVQNLPGSIQGHATDVDYGAACAALKKPGVTLYVVEAKYYEVPPSYRFGDHYTTWVTPIEKKITPALQGCASSPSTYFLATDGEGIKAAMSSISDAVRGDRTLRLSN